MSSRHHLLAVAAAVSLVAIPAAARADMDVAAMAASIRADVDTGYPKLEALYQDLHAHPEVAFQEAKTAARLAAEMRSLGFEVTEGIGKTGLVALYRNGAGPTVMVRTELDALPMEEKTGLEYASRDKTVWNGRETFVAHSCGHDIHMTAWVGAARQLVAMKAQWRGTLMFIPAQPAEETVSGAKAMLADGAFTRFPKPDVAFALHDGPTAYDTLYLTPGVRTSNSDSLEITFRGRGGHGAMPQMTIDPIVIAARFVTDLQSVLSREKDPSEFGVVSIGAIQGGTAENIIPDNVLLRGTIRTFKPDVRTKLLAGVERVAKAAALMSDAPPPEIKITEGAKAVVNDTGVTLRAEKVLRAAFGDKVRPGLPATASEDFSEFVNAGVPGMFFGIGAYPPDRVAAARDGSGPLLPANHSPAFAPVPKPTISIGVTAMTLAVLGAFNDAPVR